MADDNEALFQRMAKAQDTIREMHDRLGGVAHHDAVFGTPVQSGDQIVIPVADVTTALGFGFGMGSDDKDDAHRALGGGGGGGGVAAGHPVAVIIVDPGGVRIRPVLDYTKLGMAALTAVGGVLLLLRVMEKTKRKR